MKQSFTHLIARAVNARFGKAYLSSLIFLLLLLMGNVAWAQTINSISPTCKTAGEGSFTLTINGSGFNGNPNVLLNGTTVSSVNIINITSTVITVQVAASYIASAGNLVVTVIKGNSNPSTATLTVAPATNAGAITASQGAVCAGTQGVTYSVAAVTGATGYIWTVPTGATIVSGQNTNQITVNYSPTAASGSVTVAAVNACGTAGTTSSTPVTVTPLPTVSVTPTGSALTICSGGSVALTASGATTYTWAPAIGLSATSGATVTAAPTSTRTYTVTGTTNGCSSSTQVTVTVNPLPLAATNVTANPTSVCGSGSSTLNATPGTNGTTVRWYDAATAGNLLATNTSYSPTVSTSTTYYAASYNATTGCESSTRVPVTVTVNPLPDAPTVSDPAPLCGGGSVTLTATPGANGTTARWYAASTGGAPLATSTSYSPTVSGNTTFFVSSYNATTGCESSARVPVNVTVNPLPTNPTVTGGSVCDAGEVTLTASVGANGTLVRWYSAASGGSIINTGATYAPTVSQTTNYFVSSYNENTGCESGRVQVTATVIETPVASVIPEGPEEICSGTNTVLAANPAPAGAVYTYQWSDANGELTGETAQTLTVSEAGSYSVVITSGGLCVSEPSNVVVVTTLPLPAAPIAESASRCGPGSVTLTASGGPDGSTYRWYTTPTGGSPVATGATFDTPDLTLSRLYYVAVVGASGCESPRTDVEVTIKPLPEANIASETPRCQDPGGVTTFLLNGAANNGIFLSWEIIGGTASAEIVEDGVNDFTPTVNVTGAGTVQVRLTVESNNGCGSATAEIELEVYPIPPAVAVDVTPVERCGSGEVTLTINNPSATYTYNWYDAASTLVFTGTSYTTSINQTTSFFIAVTGTGSCENPQRTEVAAIVNPTPGIPTNVASSASALCGTGIVTLTATVGNNGTAVRWYTASTGGAVQATGSTYSPTVSATTTFYASSYNATTGCESSTRVPVTVTVNPVPAAPNSVTANPAAVCGSGSFTLTAVAGANGTTVRWYDAATAGNLLATNTSYSPTVSTSTTYYASSYNATTGCESSTRVPVTVTVNPLPTVATNVTATPSSLCGSGTVTLSGTSGTNGTTIRWYAAATGGPVLTTGLSVNRTVTGNTTFYAASYNATTGCETSSRVAVAVTVGSAIANNTITGNQTICTGSPAATITGTAATGGVGAITYVWERSTTSATTGFTAIASSNTQNYSPGALTQTTWFRRVASTPGSGCSSTTTAVKVTVNPITTYTLVLTANPFPVCQGVNTTYVATVLANVTSVNYPANPRYEQITWVGGTDVSDQFDFDWWKNDINDRAEGQTGRTVSLAGLSSTDYYTVRATPKTGASLSCPQFVNRPELTPGNPGTAALFSNRIYLGRPDNYGVTLSRTPAGSICPGTPVTFTATPNAEYVNLTMQWVVRNSAGTIVTSTPFSASRTYTTNALNNGDVVSLSFTSEENKCSPMAASNTLTMVVVIPQTMAGGGAFCAGGAGVPVSIASSQQGVTYQLLRTVGSNTVNVGTPVAGTGSAISFGNQTTTGTYTVQPISANGSCSPVYGPVNVNATSPPETYNLTGGGGYCTGGSGVPIGMANSQSGVNYQLFRSVNGGTPTAVGTARAGTGGAISFGNQTVAGTYTVIGTTVANATTAACVQAMNGSVAVTINPLPVVALQNASACEGAQATVSASVSNGTGGYTYAWTVPAGATNPGNTATFQTSVAGTYTVNVTDAASCSSVAKSSVVSFTTPLPQEEPLLEVFWIDDDTSWEVTALEAKFGEGVFGANPTYVWYRRINPATNSDGEWGSPVQTGTSNVYTENAPGDDVQIKVEVLNSASCTLYRLTNIGVTPLPVEIIYFNAAKQGNNVLLEWATASEQNNAGFEVQVSQDGFNFRKLGFVATQNGNTALKQMYQYTDKENGKRGTRYYRLKQLDTDGTFEYFTAKAVTFTEVASKVKAFPNPFTDKLTLDIAAEQRGEVQVRMSNAIGRQLLERTITVEAGFNTVNLDIRADLPHGVYFVRVYLDGKLHQLKVLKE